MLSLYYLARPGECYWGADSEIVELVKSTWKLTDLQYIRGRWVVGPYEYRENILCWCSRRNVENVEKRGRLCRNPVSHPCVPSDSESSLVRAGRKSTDLAPWIVTAQWDSNRYQWKRSRHPRDQGRKLLICPRDIAVGDWRIASADYAWQERKTPYL